jgi:hypothetical protein
LLILLSLIFIVLIAGFVFFCRIDPQQIVSFASSELKKNYFLGLDVESADINWLKGIELRNVKIVDCFSNNQAVLIQFKSSRILYNPLALLSGRMEVLIASADGVETKYEDITNIFVRFLKTDSTNTNNTFQIHSLSLKNLKLFYQNNKFDINFEINFKQKLQDSPINADIRSSYGQLLFNGTLEKAEVKLSDFNLAHFIDSHDSIFIRKMEGSLLQKGSDSFLLNVRNIELNYNQWKINSTSPFDAFYSIENEKLSVQNASLKTEKSSTRVQSFDYSFKNNTLNASFSNLYFYLSEFLPDWEGAGEGQIGLTLSNELFLNGNLKISNLQSKWAKKSFCEISIAQNRTEINCEGSSLGGLAKARLSIDSLSENSPIVVTAQSDQIDFEDFLKLLETNSTEVDSTTSNSPPAFLQNPIKLRLTAEKIKYKNLTAQNLTLEADGQNSLWNIQKAEAFFCRGKISLSGKLSGDFLEGNLDYREGKLKEFSETFLSHPQKIYGFLNLKSRFSIFLPNPFLSRGEVSAEIVNGEIKDFFVQNQIGKTLFDIPLNDIFFEDIKLSGAFNSNLLEIQKFRFNSEDIRISAKGSAQISNLTLKLKSSFSFSKNYLESLPNVTQIYTAGYENEGRLNFDLDIQGPYYKPELEIIEKD